MAYQKPQAIIHQQFETIPNITEDELRAVIVGPSAILHRYADEDEKIDIFVGVVDPDNDQTFPYPGRSAGGIVDKPYSKLYVDNALLSYFSSTDYKAAFSGVTAVKSGTDKKQVLAVATETTEDEVVTVTFTGTTIDDTVSTTAYKPAKDTPVQVFTYKETAGYVQYRRTTTETIPGQEGEDPTTEEVVGSTNNPKLADKYNVSDPTTFIHLFEPQFIQVTENNTTVSKPLYVNKEGNGVTPNVTDALLLDGTEFYPVYVISNATSSKYKFYNPTDYDNMIYCDSENGLPFNFKSTKRNSRNGELGTRDVAIGDYALIFAYTPDTSGNCTLVGPQLSRIIGFYHEDAVPEVDPELGIKITQPAATTAVDFAVKEIFIENNVESVTNNSTLATFIRSANNKINPFKYGMLDANKHLSWTYEITVAKVETDGNCIGTVWLDVRCSETGEYFTFQPKAGDGEYISDGGQYGMDEIMFTEEQLEGIRDYMTTNKDNGLKWTVNIASEYTPITPDEVKIINLKSYTGVSDTYAFTIKEGGAAGVDYGPSYAVTTAYGTEHYNGTLLSTGWYPGTADEWRVYDCQKITEDGVALGTQGLRILFQSKRMVTDDQGNDDPTDDVTTNVGGGTTNPSTGLPGGFKISIPIVGTQVDSYPGILLADNVMPDLQSNDSQNRYLQLRLLFNDDIVLPAISPYDGRTNWYQDTISFTLLEEAVTVSPEFMKYDGTYIPLMPFGFDENSDYGQFSKLFFNYREWSPIHANDVTFCESVAALDNIIGPLDPDNPLKYAVYKALTNSNGASVAYVAVKDPTDLDDWQDAMSVIEGRDDVYTIVPLSTEVNVQNLVLTLVNNESSAEACRWKTALFNMELPKEVMKIGYNKNNATNPTSTDGEPTYCKIVKNPLDHNDPINKLVCTSYNSKFIDFGVVPGDEVRILNDDGSTKFTAVVDQVYSNGTLTIMQPLTEEREGETFEIWHTYTRNEEVNVIRRRAQSVASRRVGMVWPDIVSEGGVEMPGYYLSAALAGLKSGVEPQNGLTRRTIQGFDGFTRSKPRYTESQLDLMASSGVWICVTDSDGTPQSRHALNTDTKDSFHSEEMMTRNFDSVSKYMYQVIDVYIGTSNVTDETLQSIYFNLRKACDYLIGKGQMIDYTKIVVKQHDLLLDRVLAYLDVGLPFAVNNVELFITAEAYELNAVTLESEVE